MSIDKGTLNTFFHGIRQTYSAKNPYHNFQHAMATVHYATKLAYATTFGMTGVSPTESAALIIGSLCHDCGHRGFNNAFEVETRSVLAVRYNDFSPLENHHCAQAFEIALGSDANASANVFESMSRETYIAVRKSMVAGILATDMKHHGNHVKEMQNFDPYESPSQTTVDLFLHLADIGNPMMPPDISLRWGDAIAQEFTAQTVEEERLGVTVTAFMQLSEPKAAAKSSVGFIDFVFTPLAKLVFKTFPGLLEEAKANLEINRETQNTLGACST